MDATYTVFIIVNKPVHEVFEAVADPAQLSSYFTTGGASGRLDSGETVTWDFADFPGAFPVHVGDVVADEKIMFEWKANEPGADYQLAVTIRFSAVGEGRTRVEIEESGWRDTEAARKASYGNCMGWSQCWPRSRPGPNTASTCAKGRISRPVTPAQAGVPLLIDPLP